VCYSLKTKAHILILGKGTAEALFAVDRELFLLMNVLEFKAELKLAFAISD
jgi:hypothetical protein